jgi:hypothetical protein
MYSGVGPPFKEILEKKNEWCKYDHMLIVNRLKKVANGLIAITILGWITIPTLGVYFASYDFAITISITGICIFFSLLYVSLFWIIESKKISIYRNAFCISLDPKKIDLEKIKKSVRILLTNSGIPHKLMKIEIPIEIFRSEFQRTDNNKAIIEIWSKREIEVFILVNTNHFDKMDHVHSLRDIIWMEKLP